MAKQVTLVIIGVIIFVVIIGLIALNPFVIVNAGERGVVLNWGAVSDQVMGEGIHWRTPIAQAVKKLDIKIQKEQVNVTAASKDLQTVTSTVALNYHIDATKVNTLWQKIGSEYKERIIDPAIQEAVKAGTAKFTAEELITKRADVKDAIKASLIDRLTQDFILVDEFSIVNFSFSDEFNNAIERKVTAEQNALASKNKLEQVKFEAEQRVAQATAEAEAIKIQAQAITQQGGQSYVNLKWVERWNGVLPNYVMGTDVNSLLNLPTK